jgi:hypothetical protein
MRWVPKWTISLNLGALASLEAEAGNRFWTARRLQYVSETGRSPLQEMVTLEDRELELL